MPAEAQNFLAGYKALLEKMAEPEASEATIQLIYRSYYGEMGGAGTPPDMSTRRASRARPPVAGQRHRLQAAGAEAGRRPPAVRSGAKPRLPVALIFICLVVVYVGVRYFWR